MERRTAFVAFDGETFFDEDECRTYEQSVLDSQQFKDWYENGSDSAVFGGNSRVDTTDLIDWLTENSEMVRLIID